jgi:hypothetical protein
LHAAHERDGDVGLDHEMDVVALNGEMHDAKRVLVRGRE